MSRASRRHDGTNREARRLLALAHCTLGEVDEAVKIYQGIMRPGDALLMLTDLPDTYA